MSTDTTPATGLLGSLGLLQVSLSGRVMHVRLNRPAKRNALSDPLIQQLHTAFVNIPDGVHAAVISGEGSHFCAGLDLSELVERDIHSAVLHSRMWHAAFDAAGIRVRSMRTKSNRLEELFVRMTTREGAPA